VKVTFGPLTLDDERRQLLRGGREIHLTLKAYELLRLLVTERPRAIAKSDIHARLWPDAFVSDATLMGLVAELRRALGESGRQSGFIRTVHGYGYAFAAESVQEPADRREGSGAARVPVSWLTCGQDDLSLQPGENVLGRDTHAGVCLKGTTVSKRHARIVVSDETVTIEDLGSKNGTFVEGVRIEGPIGLRDGDEIRLGRQCLTFRSLAEPGSTATAVLEDENEY
jgi:DNA-binding winged helix-turn-helix (wHTH) protein